MLRAPSGLPNLTPRQPSSRKHRECLGAFISRDTTRCRAQTLELDRYWDRVPFWDARALEAQAISAVCLEQERVSKAINAQYDAFIKRGAMNGVDEALREGTADKTDIAGVLAASFEYWGLQPPTRADVAWMTAHHQ